MNNHIGPAWILNGIMNTPGALALVDGRLSFTGDEGVVFDEPVDAVSGVTFPWYYFSGGFKATVGGTRYRISLTRPNGAPASLSRSVAELVGPELISAAGSIGDVTSGRREGKIWKSLLLDGAGASHRS
ncbi:hypothetical protein EV383_5949 [Pseudonocardia sediminis]|uniref:Uncharacterized protein n=1 Tax=Pseudonocardia sediminis TaxID=1397368 RepID=A0A4Q7V4P7_PSEST|nr:hypothetical protein [Pseudonocardia sediminis]RZT88995.1 hypothetical protein EV383_5949 [Pseudonocardia sediminis]